MAVLITVFLYDKKGVVCTLFINSSNCSIEFGMDFVLVVVF